MLVGHAAAPDMPTQFYGRVLRGILTRDEAASYTIAIREWRQAAADTRGSGLTGFAAVALR